MNELNKVHLVIAAVFFVLGALLALPVVTS